MTAADETYARLLAARRIVMPAEREEQRTASVKADMNARIRRKLARVY